MKYDGYNMPSKEQVNRKKQMKQNEPKQAGGSVSPNTGKLKYAGSPKVGKCYSTQAEAMVTASGEKRGVRPSATHEVTTR